MNRNNLDVVFAGSEEVIIVNDRRDLVIDLNTFEFKKSIDASFGTDFTDEVTLMEPVDVHIDLYKDKDSVIVTGTVNTSVEESCARCLKPVVIQIKGTIEATYVHEIMLKSVDDAGKDELENVIRLEGELLDLSDRVIEAIIVEVPLKTLCSKDCAGLCQVCGTNLNENPDHKCQDRAIVDDSWHKAISELKTKLKS